MTVAMTGLSEGKITRKNTLRNRLQPSISAASSSSLGIVLMLFAKQEDGQRQVEGE